MREIFYSYEEALTNGLRNKKLKRDKRFLISCYGLEPTEEGLRGEPTISNPISGSYHAEAQILEADTPLMIDYTQDSDETPSIKEVATATWTLGSDKLSSGQGESAADNTSQVSFVGDGLPLWQVEKDGLWLIGTEDCYVTNSAFYSPNWVVGVQASARVPIAGCIGWNRLLLGGLHTSLGYATSFWTAIWSEYLRNTSLYISDSSTMDSSWILIGPKHGGALDYPWALELCLLSEYKAADLQPTILRLIRDQEIRFVQVPRGTVLSLSPYRGDVLVYGTKGVWLLKEDLTFVEIHNRGIPSRTANTGDENNQFFIDHHSSLYHLGPEGIQELNYNIQLSNLTAASIKMFYYPADRWLYMSDGTTTYAHSGFGMWQSAYLPNSILRKSGKLYGTVSGGSTTKYFETTPSNLFFPTRDLPVSLGGIVKLNHVEIQHQGCTSITIQGGYRATPSDPTAYGPAVPTNLEDMAYIGLGGIMISTKVNCTADSDSVITNLRCGYQHADSRYTRGHSA